MRTNNSHAIIVMCSHLCKNTDVVPLEPSEWTVCAEKLLHAQKQPSDILDFSDDDFLKILNLDTVIVRSDYNKGGTWAGATENLRHKYSHTFCWNNKSYKGNIELIKLGAIPIDENFDPNAAKNPLLSKNSDENLQQMSLFEVLSSRKKIDD